MAGRIVAALTAALCLLLFFNGLFYSFADDEYATDGLSWWYKLAGRKIKGRQSGGEYLVGVGKADITGPVVELNLMGYANGSQIGTGLRQRLYSRAFVVGEPDAPENRFIYLVLDTQSGDTAVRDGVLRGLANMGPEYAMYGQHNVALTGTHSHSGPAAWLNYLLPQITAKGFDKQSYQAIVDGTLLSIKRAHEGLAPGSIAVGTTRIEDANINRSLYAYLANPEEERNKYGDDSVDKDLTLLRFTRASDKKDIGVLSWFAVHGTSMLGNNTLVTGDNKGVAAYLFEKSMGSGFVAGFSQANVGDTSPNVNGAWCEDGSGQECKLEDSTCGNKSQDCHGRGPSFGLDDGGTKSCFEIGKRQFEGARSLFAGMGASSTPVSGGTVRALHQFVSMDGYTFPHPNGTEVTTCYASMGYSFAAGTSDGPGAFDFKQNDPGDPDANPLWSVVGKALHAPSKEQEACQYPKPILLDVGGAAVPYAWSPNIVDIQILRVGQMIIIVSPGEATTMSGRRWRGAVAEAAKSSGLVGDDQAPVVVLGGPANSYTHYIATEEEYGIQRYEGASTLYGPHTLNAFINLTLTNLPYLAANAQGSPDPGPMPPINTNKSLSFITGVVVDSAGIGKKFGDVITQPSASYSAGHTVEVKFIGANPRNNLRLEGTYAMVEKLVTSDPGMLSSTGPNGEELKGRSPRLPRNIMAGLGLETRELEKRQEQKWTAFRTDEDWELVYNWKRINGLIGTSEVLIQWEVPTDVDVKGRYRIRYFGDSKSLVGKISAFEGVSAEFEVV